MTQMQLKILLYVINRLNGMLPECPICDQICSRYMFSSEAAICPCIERKLVEMLDEFDISSSDL